jgi:aminoglycoside N3'-acetyltransferase
MQAVSADHIKPILRDLGLQPADGLLVHSAIQFLGRPNGGAGMYLDAICSVIGAQGTVAVPTFNFGFARGEPYDPLVTPSVGMGAFSEYVRKLPEARRTTHPMQSLAVIGRYAGDLAGRDTPSAFDPGSAFERMLDLDFKLLLLGADWRAISIIHYSEQRANVPYRYWKDYTGPVRTPDGWQTCVYRMFSRDLDLDPQLTLEPIVAGLERLGQWRSLPLNYGYLSVCRLTDFVAAADRILAADPWALVLNRLHK